MKIIELILDEDSKMSGIDAISIVESPAIESNFIALNNHQVKFATVDTEKRILMGPALIPNKPIYRNQDGEEFYVYFSKATIEKAMQMYLKKGNQGNATLEHDGKLNPKEFVQLLVAKHIHVTITPWTLVQKIAMSALYIACVLLSTIFFFVSNAGTARISRPDGGVDSVPIFSL